jgi:hypothetical protein
MVRRLPPAGPVPGSPRPAGGLPCRYRDYLKEITMPVILWLLGVPLVVIVLLMLFGVL